jgi:hypothetical protein
MEAKVLDQGYVRLVEAWGADERIIEAARMSTAKGFLGWGPKCSNCGDLFDGDAIEDLKKARWYLDREIAKRERETAR